MTPSPLEVNGRRYGYRHHTFSIPPISLLGWLKAQRLFPKVYWSRRACESEPVQERAALGCLMTLSSPPNVGRNSHPEARFYGGQGQFWLPQIELVRQAEQTLLHLHHLEGLPLPSPLNFDWDVPSPSSQVHTPSEPEWEKIVQKALDACASRTLKKVVLARKTYTDCPFPIDPYLLLEPQRAQHPHATLFLFQGNPQSAFIGASPETLYTRLGDEVAIDALAGTAPRGPTPDLDEHYRTLLWNSPKERREFAIVKTFIHRALKPLSIKIRWNPSDQVLSLKHVHHIYNQCKASLKEGISDPRLLKALHPTPALGGSPRKKALDFIAKHESFDRGWYGAPVGYLSSQEADIAVAIRCAWVCDSQMQRFAGTGIVTGSSPREEWKELDLKIKTWEFQ